MAGNTPQLLTKHLLKGARASSSSLIWPARTFATTSRRFQSPPKETPSISNINPNETEAFNERQHHFRENLVAHKKQAERQSSFSPDHDSASSASASQVSPGESNVENTMGSHSTAAAGESREAREQKETQQWGGKKSGPLSKLIYLSLIHI